ncbi:MAG: hypothetical protein FGM27_00410 [Candidatus Omnitrophica bacterium]|nr:hypothetical protein [Candidatus Omnitrophota bacterium]
MTKRIGLFLAILILVIPPAGGRAQDPAPEGSDALRAGAARTVIRPPAGTPLSGYGKYRKKKTSGTHDALHARALSLRRGGETFVVLSLDLCLVDRQLTEAIHQKISAEYPLERSHLMITATHTHTGTGALSGRFWQRFIMGPLNREVFDHVTRQGARAALESLQALRPAEAFYGGIKIPDLIENRMKAELIFDPSIQILRFVSKDEKQPLGELFFMAAHPTLFPAGEGLFSADYPGVLADAFEKEFPGAVRVFINGAAGDLRPHAGPEEDRKIRMRAYGNAVAARVRSIVFSPADLSGPWSALWIRPQLPPVKARAGGITFPSFLGGRVFPRHAPFQALRFGPFVIFAFPGELAAEIGHEIKRRAGESGLTPLLAGYANDYIGYVVSRRHYGQTQEYEPRVSFYGRAMETFIHRMSETMIDALLRDDERRLRDRGASLNFNGALPVLHLRGSPYHRGREEGRLMKKEIRSGLENIHAYFREELKVPLINRLVIRVLGNRAWRKMSPYVRYDEYREIEGIADGAGVPLKTLLRIHAMPELFPSLCSNGAYWGEATQTGRMIAIRTLDWNRKMNVQSLAAVKIIENRSGPDVVNIGYSGFAGVLTGMNSAGLTVGQIGADSADETLAGTPMPFLIKRILEESSSIEEAAAVLRRSDRTRGYNYVVASAAEAKAMAAETTRSLTAFFRDDDPAEQTVPYALPIKHAVFRGDPALDPKIRDLQRASKGNPEKPGLEYPAGSAYEIRYLKQGRLVEQYYGSITPQTAQEIAREIAPNSNIQSVIFAYPEFWVANAQGSLRAVDSPYSAFDLKTLTEKNSGSGRGGN